MKSKRKKYYFRDEIKEETSYLSAYRVPGLVYYSSLSHIQKTSNLISHDDAKKKKKYGTKKAT